MRCGRLWSRLCSARSRRCAGVAWSARSCLQAAGFLLHCRAGLIPEEKPWTLALAARTPVAGGGMTCLVSHPDRCWRRRSRCMQAATRDPGGEHRCGGRQGAVHSRREAAGALRSARGILDAPGQALRALAAWHRRGMRSTSQRGSRRCRRWPCYGASPFLLSPSPGVALRHSCAVPGS